MGLLFMIFLECFHRMHGLWKDESRRSGWIWDKSRSKTSISQEKDSIEVAGIYISIKAQSQIKSEAGSMLRERYREIKGGGEQRILLLENFYRVLTS